jgi:hypothetical protein
MKQSRFAVLSAAISLTAFGVASAQTASPKLTNAAQTRYGARVSVATQGPGASRDPQTEPEATFDGNLRTRCVLRGAPPYTFTVELPAPVPIERLAFANTDYATERAPKDIEIRLDDDSAAVRHTLELRRPEQRRPAWQEVPFGGRTARVIKITVLSNYEPSATVNWGGLAEIAVLTSADLDARFAVPDAAAVAAVPAFVHPPTIAAGAAPARVRLPPVAAPGEHPCLLLTRAEVTELKNSLAASERGRAALTGLRGVAEGAVKVVPDFPDPKGPLGQINDRGDEIAKRHDRLALNAGTLGMAYTLTGDEKYAVRAADILRGYAERYAAYPEHKGVNRSDTGKVMGQRLSEAMWLIPLIEAYDHVYASPALTPDDRRRIETQLIRPAVAFIRRKEPSAEVAERDRATPDWRTAPPPKGGAANWLLFYNAATMMAGAVLGDQDLKDLAAADFRRLLANGIGSDGLWEEGAIGYQFFALTAITAGIEAAARQGIDLWSFDNARVKRLFDSPLRYAYPDGSAPGINDSGRTRFGDWSTMSYDYAYLRFGDPAYAFLVNASPRQLHTTTAVYFPTRVYTPLPEPKATAFPSTVFESLGYSILRGPRAYALMDYGTHGGVHGHFDKLNLILFASPGVDAKGDEMGGEPRFHRYEDPLHGEWTRQTVAHNTLTVDETNQVPSEGRLTIFEDTPDLKVMRAHTAASVPGALLDRTVVVTPDAVLDLYHGRSSYSRTWDRTFRFQGALRDFPAADATTAPLGTRDGYQHLRVASRKPVSDTPWTGLWETKVGAFTTTLAPAPGQQVLLSRGPDDDHLALARQQGERADFAAAYALDAWQNPVQKLHHLPTGNPNLAAVEMTQRDGTITTVTVSHTTGPWQALGWKSDARVLCVRRKGQNTTLLLTGGTFADGPNGTLRRPTPGNYGATRRAGKLELVASWTP